MNQSYRWSKVLLVAPIFLLASCKIYQPAALQKVNVPATFNGQTDSTSIANQSWRTFFTDDKLRQLIDTALHQNADLLMAVQRIEMSRAQFKMSKGAMLPVVNAVASAGVDKYGNYTLNGVGNFDTNLSPNIEGNKSIPNPTPDLFLGVRSTWEVDLWGKLRNKKKAAYNRFLATQAGKQLVITTLVAEVANNYYELLSQDQELQTIRKNIRLQENALEMVKVQKEAGRATQLAVQQFEAQLLNTRTAEQKVQRNMVTVQNRLSLLLGRMPGDVDRGMPIMKQEIPVAMQTGVPLDMLTLRPDIREAALEMEAAGFDMKAAKAAFYPTLSITPYLGLNAFKGNLLFSGASTAYGILGGLTAPLLNQNLLKAEYRSSIAGREHAFQAYRKTVLQGFGEVQGNLRKMELLRQQDSLKSRELEVLQGAVSTSNELFFTGYATYLEVITAQKNVLEAELELTNTRKERFQLLIDLYRSLGGGWK